MFRYREYGTHKKVYELLFICMLQNSKILTLEMRCLKLIHVYISGVRGLPCWKIYVLLLMYIIFFNFMGVPKFKGNRFMFPRIFHLSPISAVIRNFLCQWLDILSKKNCCRLSQELFLWICVEALYIYMYEREFPHIFSTVNVCQKDNWSIGKQPDTDRVHLIFRVGD